ncbi:MAG TPA: SRPBCC family protein [Candidatus Acidoferrum sp.]|nr:SRPBCC family protein [Candidatus Acidoferrum sp.]
MKFEQTVTLPADPVRVWDFVMDVRAVAECIPGIENVEPLGDDRYRMVVKVKVGPIALTLQSEIAITERDAVSRTARMRLDAADKRVGGAVKAAMAMRLEPSAEGTSLVVETDAQVMGRIGDFGQPMIRRKADQMLQEVAQNMRRTLEQAPHAS